MSANFSVQFRINEKTQTRVIRLTDTSSGFTLAKGNFSVTFPDGSTRIKTEWTSPDITSPAAYIDILAVTDNNNNVITGSYKIDFIALNAAETSYSASKTFDFNWVKPSNGITDLSDVLIPQVQFKDNTSYSPIGSFTGTPTRIFSTAFPTTSEASAQPATTTSTNTLTPVYTGNYYEGVYNVSNDITCNYTHTSNSWLTINYVELFTKTVAIKKCPTQIGLIEKINTYRGVIEAYKEKNDTQFNLLSEQYDLAIALYSHIIARYQTATQDGSEGQLRELLSILEPYTGSYTYQSTRMLPFELAASGANSFNISDGTNTDAVALGSSLLFSSGNAALVPSISNNQVNYSPVFGTEVNTFAQGNDSRFHNAVTIGTANGLSLASQVLSLALATPSTSGAFSASDKAKLDGIAAGANVGTVTSVGISAPSAFSVTNSPVTSSGVINISATGNPLQYITGAGALSTFLTDVRAGISLTTTGTSGAATYNSSTGVINIPTYTLAGLGGITATFLSGGTGITYNSTTGVISYSGTVYTDSSVRALFSGGTGITYNSSTGAISYSGTVYTDSAIRALFSASAPLSYNSTTGAFTISQANTTTNGFLSSTDWNTFNNKQNALTNPVTGTGTTNTIAKFTGTSTIGDSNITDSGTLVTLNSNTTISNGGLGIGNTSLTGYNLRIGKNITGATISYGISQSGTVQSDVTSNTYGYFNQSNTQASAFTLGEYTHYFASQGTIGSTSAITTQQGFVVNSNLTGATNNYGFRGVIPSGTGRWNIYMDGTANNYIAGSLGIGSTNLNAINFRISKSITGASTSFGIVQDGVIQSDVTGSAAIFRTNVSTLATAFTNATLVHYSASLLSIGAGSSITNQYGFVAENTLIGATNNYGFFGNIAAGTNRWNFYAGGTANNYMAGSLGIGTTSLTGINLNVTKHLTGGTVVYGIAQQGQVQSDATGSATGYYNSYSTQATAFTLGNYYHFFAQQSTIGAGSTVTNQAAFFAQSNLIGATNNYGFRGAIPSGTGRWNIYMDGTAQNYLAGDVGIGVTTNHASAKLQVDSTTEGFLPPRMTAAQRAAISTPADGLIVFQTDGTIGLYVYASAAWHALTML